MKLRSALLLLPTFLAACRGTPPPAATATTTTTAAARAAAPPSPPPPSPPVTPFGATRASRMHAVHAAVAEALAPWSLTEVGTDCTLVFAEVGEWLVGCAFDAAPPDFSTTGETYLGRPVLFNPTSLALGPQVVPYAKAKLAVVGTVASTRSDRGGAEAPVTVLQDWDSLHASHPGFTESSEEEWLGIAVHEAFHAHQMWHPTVRRRMTAWATEPPATAEDLAVFYTRDADYRRAVDDEVAALKRGVDTAATPAEARRALADWNARRAARGRAFAERLEAAYPGKRAWEMDAFYTFLEGTARYVEASWLLAGPRAGAKATALPGLSSGGRKYVYAIGMYVSFLLDRAAPGWKQRVLASDGLLVGEVERTVAAR